MLLIWVGRLHILRQLFFASFLAGSFWSAFGRAVDGGGDWQFFSAGLLPKAEIGAETFLKRYPESDGSGVVVAILDTGVDPGVEGLQRTPSGARKIIDLFDATGSGDIRMSAPVVAESDFLVGLSGRKLTISLQWDNPRREYRLGLLHAYERFPADLVARMREDAAKRRVKSKAVLLGKMQEGWQEAKESGDSSQVAEWTARLEEAEALYKELDEPGPAFDCVSFFDGSDWLVAIDTDQDGLLSDEVLLRDYWKDQEFGTFGGEIGLNYGVNIYEDGARLSVVMDSGMHGTHVAGIVAAHFPDQPDLSGVAPGAQIVSIKIGDTRLDGMETGKALARAASYLRKHPVDIINMSFGEATTRPNRGWIPQLFREVIEETGAVFISSAMNNGPALSTVGAPGATTEGIIGVGAYVPQSMMGEAYHLRELVPSGIYTWSSRGPCKDGALGVSLCGIGGAVSPVPQWTLRRNQLANGTSMAAPSVSGGVALLLSQAKKAGIEFSPYSVKTSLENSAKKLMEIDAFSQGYGLLQIPAAYEALKASEGPLASELAFRVETDSNGRPGRGLYLREGWQTVNPSFHQIHLEAVLPADLPIQKRVQFDRRFQLRCESDWVSIPSSIYLSGTRASFETRVDPRGLTGGAHYAEIVIVDTLAPSYGPVARVPITVVIPTETDWRVSQVYQRHAFFSSGAIKRFFIQPPEGATQLRLTLTGSKDALEERRFYVHARQNLEAQPDRHGGYLERLRLSPGEQKTVTFPIHQHRMLELAIAQYWSSIGKGELSLDYEFNGANVALEPFGITQGGIGARLNLKAGDGRLSVNPIVHLSKVGRALFPKSTKLVVGDSRDRFPDGRLICRQELTYAIELPEAAKVDFIVPGFNGRLYENEMESAFWMLMDHNGRWLYSDDGWSDGLPLEAGDYRLRLSIGHYERETVMSCREQAIQMEMSLAEPIELNTYEAISDLKANRKLVGPFDLQPREVRSFVFCAKGKESLPDWIQSGDRGKGSLTIGKGDAFEWETPFAASSAGKKASSVLEDSSLVGLDSADPVLHRLVEKLHQLDDEERKSRLDRVVDSANKVLALIDEKALRRRLGMGPLNESAERETELPAARLKEILVDTLYRKARAVGFMELSTLDEEWVESNASAGWSSERIESTFNETYQRLESWVDIEGSDFYRLAIRRDRRMGNLGTALKKLRPHIAGEGLKDEGLLKKRVAILRELGWRELADAEEAWLLRKFPSRPPLF